MVSLFEPEETVGQAWHRLVGGSASYKHHADAAVTLDEVRPGLGVMFRALGGNGGVRLAGALRDLKGQDLEEGVSTRLLVYCATLIAAGMRMERAILAAMIEPLTDDPDIRKALLRVIDITLG